MKARGVKTRRVGPVLWAGFTQDLERAPALLALDPARADLVRILSRLTLDVERFESKVQNERQRLQQHVAQEGADDDDEFGHRSTRLSLGAAEVATSARRALDELQRLSRVPEHGHMQWYERQSAHGLSEDQPAG